MPFVKGMVGSYNDSPRDHQIGLLAMFAPYFPVAVTAQLFGVSPYKVAAAKLHDADGMARQPAPKQVHERMRLGGRTFAFMHQWCRSTYAVTANEASSVDFKMLEIRSRLYTCYAAMAKDELGVEAVSIDKFMKHMRHGFVDETVESCCCGGCVDGWTALSMLHGFVGDPQYEFPARKELASRVDKIQRFLKGDYRLKHLQEQSSEASHCMQHALGCSCSALSEGCDHQHVNSCVECNILPMLIHELEQHIECRHSEKLKVMQTVRGPV